MQTVSDSFHEMAQNSIVPIDWNLRISFTKEIDDDVTFFTLDQSVLDGTDVLAPSDDNPLQTWDKYAYDPYDDRVIDMEWTREIGFPYSVQSAMADITLNNFDGYFTPDSGSPIADYIIPARPLRIFAGYKTATTVQQLVGLTQDMPTIDEKEKTISFHVLDFLSDIFTLDLTDTLAMQNVTTDIVLAAIFEQFGLSEDQYSLAKGRNKIPFVFIEAGMNAGNVLNQLMQAEMGKLWLDEQGIIRFDQRLLSSQTPVMTFNESNIENIQVSDKDNIINTIKITSNIRKVQDFQPIFSKVNASLSDAETASTPDLTTAFIIPAGSTAFYPNAVLADPVLSAAVPTIGKKTDTSWFTAIKTDGTSVTSNVSITLDELKTSSYTMLFSNTNTFDVVIDQVEVWGEPAKVMDTINYMATDDDSVLKYGTKILGGEQGINNDYFGNQSNCDSFADFILGSGYPEYSGVIEIEAKGDFSLQLNDIVHVNYRTYNHDYQIIKIVDGLKKGLSTITAKKYTSFDWFVLDQSVLNGTDVLAP